MLKLHRLELSGFKSFVERTELEFSGGITAIVGPNGCGKSNLVDAVVWVLGERSAKQLRGETMSDVIFGGTKDRQPLGMASAELTLLSEMDFPGSEGGRVKIGRRVHQSGEGEYFLNGARSRLKDIRDLLMDTGLGIRAYSVIEQGKVGLILSGKPQERRRLIEEAAGVTRYRERRRVAEVKLEEAQSNLDRLEDIVSEVERRLRSLKRQAGAARRYRQRQQEVRRLERSVLRGRLAAQLERHEESARRVDELTDRNAEAVASIHRLEVELAAARDSVDDANETVAERHDRRSAVAAVIEGSQQFLRSARERKTELDERLRSGDERDRERREALTELRSRLQRLEEQIAELDSQHRDADAETSLDTDRLDAADRAVHDADAKLERHRAELLSSHGQLSENRNALNRIQLERTRGELRDQQLVHALEKNATALEEAASEADETSQRVATARREHDEAEQRLQELQAELAQHRERHRSLREESQQCASRLDRCVQRLEMLRELSDLQDERRRELEERLTAAGRATPQFLGSHLEAAPGWEEALDHFLADLADALLIPDDDASGPWIQALHEIPGRHVLLRSGRALGRERQPRDDAVLGPLTDALRLPPTIGTGLPPAWLVEDAEDAERLAANYPGQAFVSRAGVVARDGLLLVRGSGMKPGRLSQRREIRQQKVDETRLRTEAQRLQTAVETEGDEISRTESEVDEVRRRLGESARQLAVAETRNEDAESRRRRLRVERQTLETEHDEIGRELDSLRQQEERLRAETAELNDRHTELEATFDELQLALEEARESRVALQTAGADHRGRLEVLNERLDSCRRSRERIRDQIQEHERELDRWQEERERLLGRIDRLQQEVASSESELQQNLEASDTLDRRLTEAAESADSRRAEVQELEARLEKARAAEAELREDLSRARERRATAQSECDHIVSQFRDRLDEAPPDPESLSPPPENLDELATELKEQRARLASGGAVNLLAAEEYEEQQERHSFLTEQRDDVAESVERLRTTIHEIDATSAERFSTTFEVVNQNFQEIFQTLFRGGEAEMRLQDEEDLLESGIQIVARPPGKRLQNIMLLSGGEKALTAIALLFALFQTKPSPFCILDEVDAALDEVNTIRFVELLKRLADETQFVVITHNKLTMESASRLYGVTMQERGISQLVAVELSEVQPESTTEAASA